MPSITLAYAWTDTAGKTHKPDSTVDVDDATAADLTMSGWARPAGKES